MFATHLSEVKSASPIYYGWVIVATAFITLGFALGVWYSFSVFFLAITREFGWSYAATSSIFTLFLVSHALCGMLAIGLACLLLWIAAPRKVRKILRK